MLQSMGSQRVEHHLMTELDRDLFKKIGNTKGTFHAKMAIVKDRNSKNLTEAEKMMKRWQENTELYKKIFMTLITMMVWSLT